MKWLLGAQLGGLLAAGQCSSWVSAGCCEGNGSSRSVRVWIGGRMISGCLGLLLGKCGHQLLPVTHRHAPVNICTVCSRATILPPHSQLYKKSSQLDDGWMPFHLSCFLTSNRMCDVIAGMICVIVIAMHSDWFIKKLGFSGNTGKWKI